MLVTSEVEYFLLPNPSHVLYIRLTLCVRDRCSGTDQQMSLNTHVCIYLFIVYVTEEHNTAVDISLYISETA